MSSFRFRPLTRDDFGQLSRWLALPHVERWWREDPEPSAVEASYGPTVDGADPTEVFVVEREGRPIGIIQRYKLSDDANWQRVMAVAYEGDAAGIDYLIGEEGLIGQGLGPEMIERFVEDIWARYPDVPAVVVDVQQDNRRSWRALEKAGFERIWSGVLDSDDPSDEGPSHVYMRRRPVPGGQTPSSPLT